MASHHPVPVDAETVSLVEEVSVGTQTVSRKRKLSMETESADGMSDSEHGLVQGEESRSEMDETRARHAAGDDLDLLPVAPNMEAGGSHLQATAEGREGANRGLGPRLARDPPNGRVPGASGREARREGGCGGEEACAAGEGTLPARRRRTRSQPPRRPRRQDQSREARC